MITSFKNPKIKLVRDLLSQKKYREKESSFVVEGVRLAEEALAAGYIPSLILYSDSLSERGREILQTLDAGQTSIEEIDADLLDKVSATSTSQGILMVFPQPAENPELAGEPVLVLDQMRDPGNLGTILRSASAFGFETVILTPGSVDPFAPKVLRAGMGAHFKLKLQVMDADAIRQLCQSAGDEKLTILLADADAGQNCWKTNLTRPLCLIIGSEAFGAETEVRKITDERVLIPMQANNESLNAAMAASILMYEVYRQRKRT